MDLEIFAVVSAALVASLALLYYAAVWLPREFDARIIESLAAFSKAIELRFPSHRGTTELAMERTLELGRRFGLSQKRLADLEMATRLRDLGLVAVPYRLVNGTDLSQWTPEEQMIYDRHPEIGAAMIEQVPQLKRLGKIVRYHHVRWSRTVDRIDVPFESRILKVVTDFGWLEREQGSEQAKAILSRLSAQDYDPEVVRHFLSMLNWEREPGFATATVQV